MDTGRSSSGPGLNFDQRGNRVYSSYELIMVVYEAWLQDNLRWVIQGRRWRKAGDVRWTTVYEYALFAFWYAAQKYLADLGYPFWLVEVI